MRERHRVRGARLHAAPGPRRPPAHPAHRPLAFARGSGPDEETARRLWAAADPAHPPRRRPAPYVPSRFTTPAGLVRAMNAVRATAPEASLSALARVAGPGSPPALCTGS
ncbi:hypothetical protein [Streptomyces toxytricini]|uniref:hypothetical protein n=1 Tax=Streptomyces toxytricini TaxID=67369 RepID=UPI003434AF5E